jgi:hypothetical protein
VTYEPEAQAKENAMTTLNADQVWMDRLNGIAEPVEILGPDGRVMGTYTPALSPEEEEAYRAAAALFDTAELDRIEKEGGPVYTIEQVWEHIHSMEKPG